MITGRSNAGGRCVAVVPAHHAESTLAATLRSLLIDNGDRVDRVVVVTAEGDRSADVARGVAGVEVVESPRRLSAGLARDMGRAAAGPSSLILFVDADCRVEAGAVGRLAEALDRRRLDVAAACVANAGPGLIAWLRHLLEFKDAEPGVEASLPWLLPSATMLCRAEAFDAVGGFPDMWPGEDLVFCQRLHDLGARIAKVEDATTWHRHPRGWRPFFAHQYRLGATSAQARAMIPMHGSFFVRHALAAPVLLVGRCARLLAWLAAHHRGMLPFFLLVSPLYVAGLASWTAGFTAAAVAAERGRNDR